jgi:hypothetical protein
MSVGSAESAMAGLFGYTREAVRVKAKVYTHPNSPWFIFHSVID